MLEEQGELILKTSQPKGQSGLPLAAEMILRAIAEQVETLADSHMYNQSQEDPIQTVQSQELIGILSDFHRKLQSHFQSVQEASKVNHSFDNQWENMTKGLRDLVQSQRTFQSKLKATSIFLFNQSKSYTKTTNTLAQMARTAERIVSGLRNNFEKESVPEISFNRISVYGAKIFQILDFLESENSESTAEVNRLRANEKKSNALLLSMNDSLSKNSDIINNLITLSDSVKAKVQHLQLLSVNTGIEAANSELQESGLNFIASELKLVTEQLAATQRDITQNLLTLCEYTNESTIASEHLIQRLRQAGAKENFEAQSDTNKNSCPYDKEAIRVEFHDEIEKLKNIRSNEGFSTINADKECHSLIKSVQEYQQFISKESHALKQILVGLNTLNQDEVRYEGVVEALRHDHKILRSIRQSLSSTLEGLKLGAEKLESECQSVTTAAERGLSFSLRTQPSESQVSEINEQLKQCAQEIFSLVDTPERSQRTAS